MMEYLLDLKITDCFWKDRVARRAINHVTDTDDDDHLGSFIYHYGFIFYDQSLFTLMRIKKNAAHSIKS